MEDLETKQGRGMMIAAWVYIALRIISVPVLAGGLLWAMVSAVRTHNVTFWMVSTIVLLIALAVVVSRDKKVVVERFDSLSREPMFFEDEGMTESERQLLSAVAGMGRTSVTYKQLSDSLGWESHRKVEHTVQALRKRGMIHTERNGKLGTIFTVGVSVGL